MALRRPPKRQQCAWIQDRHRGHEGTALLARYGFAGPIKYQPIDKKANQWLIGGDVCLDLGCTATLPMFSAHFGDTTDDEIPNQAQSVMDILDAIGGQPACSWVT